MDQVRRQFETNVFGLLRMCQLVLPGMRRQGWGRIVNISSMGGRVVFPGGGIYHGTKFAVEAISDAMRWEVRNFGVDVILIEPGLIKTEFGETAAHSVNDATPSEGPVRRVQPAGRGDDRRRLRGARHDRARGRRQADREGDLAQAARGALPDHGRSARAARRAEAAARARLGRADADPVQAAGRLGSHSAGKTFGNAALYSGTTRRACSAAGRPSM